MGGQKIFSLAPLANELVPPLLKLLRRPCVLLFFDVAITGNGAAAAAAAAAASVSYQRGKGDFRNLVDNFHESKAGSIPDSGQILDLQFDGGGGRLKLSRASHFVYRLVSSSICMITVNHSKYHIFTASGIMLLSKVHSSSIR